MKTSAATFPVPVPWTAGQWSGLFLTDVVGDIRLHAFVYDWIQALQRSGELKTALRLLFDGEAQLDPEYATITRMGATYHRLDCELVALGKEGHAVAHKRFVLGAALACGCDLVSKRLPEQDRARAVEMVRQWRTMLAYLTIRCLSDHFGHEPWGPQHRTA